MTETRRAARCRELASDVREMMQVTHSQVEELGQSVKGAVEAHMAVRAAAHKEIQTAQQRAKDAQVCSAAHHAMHACTAGNM